MELLFNTDAIGKIKDEAESNPKSRIAVIFSERNSGDVLSYINLNLGRNHGLYVGHVRSFKGVEFDTVFAMIKDMSPNEEYVAYTRAMSKLYIVTPNIKSS